MQPRAFIYISANSMLLIAGFLVFFFARVAASATYMQYLQRGIYIFKRHFSRPVCVFHVHIYAYIFLYSRAPPNGCRKWEEEPTGCGSHAAVQIERPDDDGRKYFFFSFGGLADKIEFGFTVWVVGMQEKKGTRQSGGFGPGTLEDVSELGVVWLYQPLQICLSFIRNIKTVFRVPRIENWICLLRRAHIIYSFWNCTFGTNATVSYSLRALSPPLLSFQSIIIIYRSDL